MQTPDGVWIIPALIGLWLLGAAARWAINRRQRARRGFGDWDHLFPPRQD
jgi:hypothetical protein